MAENQEKQGLSKEQLEAMNKRYLELVGFVSHEIKGILASIVLNVYSLQNQLLGPINGAQAKVLDSVARNLDYLSHTVKNFLNFSRIEKDEMALNKTDVLIKENVFDVSLEAVKQQADERKVTIINNIPPGLRVKADSDLLHIVANNLISNALKYGAHNGKVLLSSREINGMVEVEVYNDGKPIPAVDLDKLFKKFSRLTYEDTEKAKGTGIGLFITKEIVTRHGGTIWAQPKENGNSFVFQIRKE